MSKPKVCAQNPNRFEKVPDPFIADEEVSVEFVPLDEDDMSTSVRIVSDSYLMNWVNTIWTAFAEEVPVSKKFIPRIHIVDNPENQDAKWSNYYVLPHKLFDLTERERWQVYNDGTLVVFVLDRMQGCTNPLFIPMVRLRGKISTDLCRTIIERQCKLHLQFPRMQFKLRTRWSGVSEVAAKGQQQQQ